VGAHADGSIVMEAYEVPRQRTAKCGHAARAPCAGPRRDGRPLWLTITKYSDPLLALLLKGRRKQVFAERTELTGADGGEVKVVDSTARAARMAHLMALAAKRKAGEDFTDLA
jgi:hypothetical protein